MDPIKPSNTGVAETIASPSATHEATAGANRICFEGSEPFSITDVNESLSIDFTYQKDGDEEGKKLSITIGKDTPLFEHLRLLSNKPGGEEVAKELVSQYITAILSVHELGSDNITKVSAVFDSHSHCSKILKGEEEVMSGPAGSSISSLSKTLSSLATASKVNQIYKSVLGESEAFKGRKPGALFSPSETEINKGSQTDHSGPADARKVKDLIKRLNAFSTPGVRFNPNREDKDLVGGTCTAMSLNFLEQFFENRKFTRLEGEETAALRAIQKIAKDNHIAKSSEKFRIIQAAFNQIERDPGTVAEDFNKAKIEAMAKNYGIDVTSVGEAVKLRRENALGKIQNIVTNLEEGEPYLIRQLEPDESSKKEKKGHSMVCVKEGDDLYFYDPNQGTKKIAFGDGSILHGHLQKVLSDHDVGLVRFYKMSKREGEP